MELRPYQQEGVHAILRELRQHRSTVWVCPTGGGKSWVFCAVAAQRRGRVLVLADRVALIEQAAGNFAKHAPSVDVECVTVQTASKPRWLAAHDADAFSMIIIDEADLAIAPTYRRIVEHFPKAKIVGVTATPDRHDGKPLGELFESVAGVVEIVDLIRAGYLARIRQRLIQVESVELDDVAVTHGDFNRVALGDILSKERPLHEVARVTLDYAGDAPTIVFAASIPHAEALCDVFNRYRRGCARVIHSQQEEDDGAIRDAYARREFQFLINVAMLTRGVDLPLTKCIAMAAPTMSRPRYAQMLGRGTRPMPGNPPLLVLDFKGNGSIHKLATILDVLGGKASAEQRVRAGERLREHEGADVLDELDKAEKDLLADPALRERVRAKVKAQTAEIDPFRDVKTKTDPFRDVDWMKSNAQIGREIGKSITAVWNRRKALGIPSLPRSEITRKAKAAMTPEQRSEVARKASATRTPEQRSEIVRKAKAAMTPEQRSEAARKAKAAMTPEQRSEAARKAKAAMTPEQRREAACIARAAMTFEKRSAAAHKKWAAMTSEQRSALVRKGHKNRASRRSGSGTRLP